jgi:Uma2 family endonuclease
VATDAKVTGAALQPPITVQQWGELEGPPHYELVNGHLQEKPDVAFWHEILLGSLFSLLHQFVKEHGLGILVSSKAKLKIHEFGGREPDIFLVAKDQFHLVGKNLFKGVPPLAVEILSPTNEDTDRVEKFAEYAQLGIDQYWIVDFANRRFEIYGLLRNPKTGNRYELLETISGNAIFHPSMFPGLEIPLQEIWPTQFEHCTDE